MNQPRGMALLVVLWLLALLSVVLAGVASAVQVQLRQALAVRNQTEAHLAAEAGLSLAVAGLLVGAPQARWHADGQVHTTTFAGAQLAIRVRGEQGKLDLNAAPAKEVARVLGRCGATASAAGGIASALATRQHGDAPIALLEEFRALPGNTFALYQCALPYLTVWSGAPQPDPALAAPWLAAALHLPQIQGVAQAQGVAPGLNPGQVVTVSSHATLANGYEHRLHVTLTLTSPQAGARPYRALRWQE